MGSGDFATRELILELKTVISDHGHQLRQVNQNLERIASAMDRSAAQMDDRKDNTFARNIEDLINDLKHNELSGLADIYESMQGLNRSIKQFLAGRDGASPGTEGKPGGEGKNESDRKV